MADYEVTALARGLKILTYLQEHGTQRLTDVALGVGLPSATAFRLLATLVDLGYVTRDDRSYRLANALPYQPLQERLDWATVPPAKDLARTWGVNAYIGILRGSAVVITQVVLAAATPEEYEKIGGRTPINASALGKAIVAWLPASQQQAVMAALPAAQPHAHTLTGEALATNLAMIHQKGFALDDEESERGLRCLAVPIRHQGRVVAALGVAGATATLPRHQLRTLACALQTCSQTIAAGL
ncbi:MAG: IclR family transcriptional regulator [Lactobacillus sp.]|jgi:DNA-binding IclR family transcriptional regulator|nr:IclR family transcriptional regulator [Lactobacillus sp.]MCI2033987.1 IclR family transcriptional regulator [Lactobacillus sp.]